MFGLRLGGSPIRCATGIDAKEIHSTWMGAMASAGLGVLYVPSEILGRGSELCICDRLGAVLQHHGLSAQLPCILGLGLLYQAVLSRRSILAILWP